MLLVQGPGNLHALNVRQTNSESAECGEQDIIQWAQERQMEFSVRMTRMLCKLDGEYLFQIHQIR